MQTYGKYLACRLHPQLLPICAQRDIAALIGAGGAGLYAFNRKAAKRHFKRKTRTAGTVLSGTALGAGVGAAAGHGKGAAIGAGAGALGSYVYSRKTRHRQKAHHRRY